MIINQLKPYCEGCGLRDMEFETITRISAEDFKFCTTYVYCANYSMCAYLYKHFTKFYEKVEK